jgi:hypothetical protein
MVGEKPGFLVGHHPGIGPESLELRGIEFLADRKPPESVSLRTAGSPDFEVPQFLPFDGEHECDELLRDRAVRGAAEHSDGINPDR